MASGLAPSTEVSVTLCIPSWNRADLVAETLESVIAQTRTDWEAIVVDDGSTDDSLRVISALAAKDPRIRLMSRDREPKGACTCRNIAVERARGRYVMFLDTDDLLAPFCVEQRVAVMDADSSLDFAIFPMFVFEGSPESAERLWNVETGEDDLVRLLHLDPVCQGTGTLWLKESFRRVGLWAERANIWQDIELHLRAFTGNYRFIKRLDLPPDVYLRETTASLSRGAYQSREKVEGRASVAKQAVAQLRASGKARLIPETRFLFAGIILGAMGSGNMDLARDLRRWAANEGVFRNDELWRLRLAEWMRVSRLDRVPGAASLRSSLTRAFHVESRVGQVRVQQGAIRGPAVSAH